jgi:DNA-3-methyladenine glycosylase II
MPADPHKQRIRTRAALESRLTRLVALDPRLAPVCRAAGEVPMRKGRGGFAGLAGIVVAQQVSVASANAVMARLEALVGEMTAERFLAAPEADIRQCGLSGSKFRTIRGIAGAERAEAIDYRGLPRMPVADAIAHLTGLHGIGVWTAEIYLLFHLGHPDVFPAGDLALRKMVGAVLGHDQRPDEQACREIAIGWSPHRSAAARLLWRYFAVLNRRQGVAA